MPSIAKQYKTNREEHDRTANEWAVKYANATQGVFYSKEKRYKVIEQCLLKIFGAISEAIILPIVTDMDGFNLPAILKLEEEERKKQAKESKIKWDKYMKLIGIVNKELENEKNENKNKKNGKDNNNNDTIFVKTSTGKTLMFCCNMNDYVLKVKCRIQNKEGIPPEQQKIVFAGKMLENDKKLVDYGINHQSTLHLVLRVRSG